MPALAGQVVLITGASAGIGAAVARRLARAGMRVVVTARRLEPLTALARELDATGERVLACGGDVGVAEDRARWVREARAKFGRIDALVNNAGYGTRGPVELVPVEAVRRNFETNVFALIALTQLVLPLMRAQGSGAVVNLGSVAGRIARPWSGIYDATKHALEAVTDALRGELRPFGIRVTLIRPGYIATEFVDAADAASAAHLADAGAYAPFQAAFRSGYNRLRRVAGTPDDIARLVERALRSDDPAPRYNGPLHAKVFLCLRWLLPDRLLAHLVRLRR